MPLAVLSRRSLVYREPGKGELVLLLVPGRDQIQVVKDIAGLGKAEMAPREAAAGKKAQAARKQVQLSRVFIGRRFIYGTLPTEISDLRQPVKVWLAEDFAPVQSQAFFFVFDTDVVIHGVREQDDEGQQTWRTAQLRLDGADPLKAIIDAISDYALANTTETLTVAVQNKLDIYEKLQQGLATYNVSPVPFSKLRPLSTTKPLYKHRDYTILYLTLALFGLITVLGSSSYATLTWLQRSKLETQVADIQQKIDSIKRNETIGTITDPQAVLQAISRGVNQQPSAVVHAAADVGAALGELNNVRVLFDSSGDQGGISLPAAGEGQVNAILNLTKMKDDLLLSQEGAANDVLATHPWVRLIARGGSVGDAGVVGITLQIDQTPDMTNPPAPPAAEASTTTVTSTTTAVAPVPFVSPTASPVAAAIPSSSSVMPVAPVSFTAPVSGTSVSPSAMPAAVSATLPPLPSLPQGGPAR